MLPQGNVPAGDDPAREMPDDERQTDYYPPLERMPRRVSVRARILVFALVAGGILAVCLGLTITVLQFMVRDQRSRVFGDLDNWPFLPALFQTIATLAPYLFLVAAIAAAAEVLSRRAARASGQSMQALADAIVKASRRSNRESASSPSPEAGSWEPAQGNAPAPPPLRAIHSRDETQR